MISRGYSQIERCCPCDAQHRRNSPAHTIIDNTANEDDDPNNPEKVHLVITAPFFKECTICAAWVLGNGTFGRYSHPWGIATFVCAVPLLGRKCAVMVTDGAWMGTMMTKSPWQVAAPCAS